jgi:thiazole tautomerase (transcriptional regulator TenI)
MLPRLHIVTDDAVLARPSFVTGASAILAACGSDVALHVRGHATSGAQLYDVAAELATAALRSGSWLLVNDRIDVAMAVRANGVQLGLRSLAISDARRLLGAGAQIGYSAHAAAEVALAGAHGADFALLGNIYETRSHERRAPLGVEALRDIARHSPVPVIAIGGVTPPRAVELARSGAHGVAVLGGIWHASDVHDAAMQYLTALRGAWQESGTV